MHNHNPSQFDQNAFQKKNILLDQKQRSFAFINFLWLNHWIVFSSEGGASAPLIRTPMIEACHETEFSCDMQRLVTAIPPIHLFT